jgi:hypothetical protein
VAEGLTVVGIPARSPKGCDEEATVGYGMPVRAGADPLGEEVAALRAEVAALRAMLQAHSLDRAG